MRLPEDPCRCRASEDRDDWADIERELDECVARSARDWRPLPGDADYLVGANPSPTETDEAGDPA